jgi:hypothetical protein
VELRGLAGPRAEVHRQALAPTATLLKELFPPVTTGGGPRPRTPDNQPAKSGQWTMTRAVVIAIGRVSHSTNAIDVRVQIHRWNGAS